jgi:hypothetical protein
MKQINRILSSIPETVWPVKANTRDPRRTYFPKSIKLEDIDSGVYNYVVSKKIEINGRAIPAIYLSFEKWSQFQKTWKYTDADRNVDYPLIVIRRRQIAQTSEGRNRIPGYTSITYRLPTYSKSGVVYKLYKIPQPVKVDISYELRIISNYMSDINIVNEAILKHFASIQAYLSIENHYMPLSIQSIEDASEELNAKDERILQTIYNLKINASLIDESEFEIKDSPTTVTVVNIVEE